MAAPAKPLPTVELEDVLAWLFVITAMSMFVTLGTLIGVQIVQYSNDYKYGFYAPYFWAALFIELGFAIPFFVAALVSHGFKGKAT